MKFKEYVTEAKTQMDAEGEHVETKNEELGETNIVYYLDERGNMQSTVVTYKEVDRFLKSKDFIKASWAGGKSQSGTDKIPAENIQAIQKTTSRIETRRIYNTKTIYKQK
jgi:hypothetical protein